MIDTPTNKVTGNSRKGRCDSKSVVVVEDDAALRDAMCQTLALGGFSVIPASNAEECLTLANSRRVGLVISDVQMPGINGHALMEQLHQSQPKLPVALVTAFGSVERAVDAMQHGAADYLVKPFEGKVLLGMAARLLADETQYAENDSHSEQDSGAIQAQSSDEKNDIVQDVTDQGVIAEDESTLQALRLAGRVAAADATVMISGESGTGKEVFARYIHQHSPRAAAPFVAINCAAIPESMLESILFGYEKGAFTGAYKSCAGKFEQADGGTLLLDEISEMDISLQAKLLRVLQEKEVERLGGSRSIPLDVRVLATTNRNLQEQVALGHFREDLFYRLNVFPLQLPALRERPADVMPLVRHFAAVYQGSQNPVSIDSQAELLLKSHSWPGNVRELENVVHRAVIMMSGNKMIADDLSFEVSACVSKPDAAQQDVALIEKPSLENDLKAQEQQSILNALRAENGNRQGAANRLGISPRTLRYKLAKFKKEGLHLPELASI